MYSMHCVPRYGVYLMISVGGGCRCQKTIRHVNRKCPLGNSSLLVLPLSLQVRWFWAAFSSHIEGLVRVAQTLRPVVPRNSASEQVPFLISLDCPAPPRGRPLIPASRASISPGYLSWSTGGSIKVLNRVKEELGRDIPHSGDASSIQSHTLAQLGLPTLSRSWWSRRGCRSRSRRGAR